MRYFAALLFLLLSARPAPAQVRPAPADRAVLVLRDTARSYPLGWYWSLLADARPAARPLTLAQVRAAPYAAQFRPSTEAVPNRNAAPADYWLRCQVRSEARAATAWLFSLGVANARAFEVYAVADDGQVFHHMVADGPYLPPDHAVPSRVVNFALPLRPGRTYTLYVHSWADLFSFNLAERTHFLALNRLGDVLAALYFGILLALVAYNLLLYFSVRDRGYGYYVLFTLSFGLLQAHMMGYFQWLGPGGLGGDAQNVVQQVLLGTNLAAGIQMARAFLDTARQLPRFDRGLRAALLLTPLPVLSLWLQWAPLAATAVVVPLLVCGLLIGAGLWQLWAGYRPARYFMAGWALLVAAIVAYYLRTLGVLPVSFLTEHGVRIASALEVILLSLGLADRINLARQERQTAQQQALAALEQKDEVQQRANQALGQRAEELLQAYSELRESLRTTGRLQELDELKTRFFTNISHELRTPLTLILGPLEELRAAATPPAPAVLAAQHALMHRHATRLLELINQLLDIARLEAGQLRLRAQRLNLAPYVQGIVAAFDSLAATRGLRLRAVVPAAGADAVVDRDQLEKVLTNLLGNALKFTPAGGKIQVTLTTEAAHAVLVVADTGPGIPAAHLPFIFDRFHQVDDSPGRPHAGSGIGLALVKELVALHHGTVAVQSTEGMGTTFTVRLPLDASLNEELGMRNEEFPVLGADAGLDEEESSKEEQLNGHQAMAEADNNSSFFIPNSSLSAASRPLVLIVDDHADMRAYVASCLQAEFQTLTAEEGEAGLAIITDTVPDLVVSDLMMPGLDGLELCRRLKTDQRTSHIPVVLLTARTTDDSRLAGLELGADDYLTKPFRPQELRARVRNLLRQRNLLRARFGREVTLQPRDIAITSADEVFLTRALAVVEKEMANAEFDVEHFAEALHLSRIQLYRKLKALTDQAPTDFVRTLRLRRAAQLLAAQAGNVADVAYLVGFTNLSYFSKCFRAQFGHAPSEHATSPM